eukprot:scaffold11711_cov110-Phaeocystis_antarctica.AAC.1
MGVSCHLAHALDSGGELGAAACRCIPRHAGPAAGAGWAGPWRLRPRQGYSKCQNDRFAATATL